MPKLPMDYSKCCIYKIEHVDDESLVYVGHTTNFNKRKTEHKNNCKNDKCKKYNLKKYQMIRENGGWDAFKMIEVEKYPCNDKREAERRENEVMKELKASMNMRNSFRTEEEITEYKKERSKEYYNTNKPKIQEQMKEYRELNKEILKEKKKKYHEANKEIIQEKRKKRYEANKEKINAKVKCECGVNVVKRNLNEHQATKKHLNIMKNMNAIIQ